MKCPNCQHLRQPHDPGVNAGICPACGIAYAKWQAKVDQANSPREHPEALEPLPPKVPMKWRLAKQFLFVPSNRHESAFWGYGLLYVIFFVWGWSFILHGINWDYIGSSFLHYPNLAFHEFGHVAFSGFGELMMFMGGSLFQIMLPMVLIVAFTYFKQDNFAASLCLWWTGQNFIDVSPYILDAPTRYIPLTGNAGPESHDWWNIFMMTGQMDMAGFYANLWFAVGAMLIIASNVWGAALFYIELQGRGVINQDEEGFETD